MSEKNGWADVFKKCVIFCKDYYSILGLKIAATVGSFMFLSILGYIFLHEYRHEGANEIYSMITSPFLWAGFLLMFVAIMGFLSKVVILPLKRFELHISELEEGKTKAPLVLKRNDEIGYLAERFNSLYRVVTERIEARDIQFSTLYNFTNATSGVFDIHSLMDNFFSILKTAVDFDMGAYVLTHKNHVDGRIYSTFDGLDNSGAEEVTKRVLARAGDYCGDFPKDRITRLEVVKISGRNNLYGSKSGVPTHFIEMPLLSRGMPIGIISLVSYSSDGVEPLRGTKVFTAMVQHTNSVMEKLLTHIFAEEKKLAHILSSMSEGVYIIDQSGHAASINKKGKELVALFCKNNMECAHKGYEPGLGICPDGRDACEFSGIINKVRNFGPEFENKIHTEEIKNKEGMIFQISVSDLRTEDGSKEGFVITAKDVTEDRLMQKRVLLSSKLAALGEMAAGIAHEVNNPLQVMLANIELIEGSVAEKGARRLENVKDGIMRIKGIVRDLLIFAREQTTEVEDVDINKVIEKVSDILGHQLKLANANLDLDLDRRSLIVKCNKNLFQQVIINLLQNAKDAFEESRKGSRVYIRTVLLPGGIVVVEVSDDGPGIPENVIDRVFDPFFTTKDVGKGTGLGLSVSRRILEGMGGNIAVCSSPRTGTTFTITLLHNRAARRKEDRAGDGAVQDYSGLAAKSVIIVDDEEGVVRAVKESIGPRVSSIDSSMDGRGALDKIMDKDYDLILLDVKMPGMNGMELYRNINTAKPYLAQRIIFLTGDTENESTESFLKLTGCRYLAKPFTMKDLLNTMCRYEMEKI